MAIHSTGANFSPQEPQKSISQNVVEKNGKYYSIFDVKPQDGTVSTEEQKSAFESSVQMLCSQIRINVTEFFNKIANKFAAIKTDGTEESAEKASETVKSRILQGENLIKLENKKWQTLAAKYKGAEFDKSQPNYTATEAKVKADIKKGLIPGYVIMDDGEIYTKEDNRRVPIEDVINDMKNKMNQS